MSKMQILVTIDFQGMSVDTSIVKEVPELGKINEAISMGVGEIIETYISESCALATLMEEELAKKRHND